MTSQDDLWQGLMRDEIPVMNNLCHGLRTIGLFILLLPSLVASELWVSPLFSDGMVLQSEKPIAVWGKAAAGTEVEVELDTCTVKNQAGADGKWRVNLDSRHAGGPYQMKIKAGVQEMVFKDVMIGQVWLCSGQSNMVLEVFKTSEANTPVENDPLLRVFTLGRKASAQPDENMSVKSIEKLNWIGTRADTAAGFSAVAYHFGKAIREATGEAVGMIVSAVGGTEIDTWTDRETLQSHPELSGIVERWETHLKQLPELEAEHVKKMAEWIIEAEKAKSEGVVPKRQPGAPVKAGSRNALSANFNAMLYPLIPYTLRGFLWYQGENDGGPARANLYEKNFSAFIQSLRRHWKDESLPFYYVQVANYGNRNSDSPSMAAIVREAQRMALKLPHVGMAVTIDIGEAQDIHPKNKKDVGLRLARHALANEYGKKIQKSGPLVKSASRSGESILVEFTDAEGLNVPDQQAPAQFEVGDESGHFTKVNAKMDGEKVVINWPKEKSANSVRYAWAANPLANLYNSAHLPASPFQVAVTTQK